MEQQTGVGEEVLEHRAEGIAAQQTSEIPVEWVMEILGQQTTEALEQQTEPRPTEEEPRIPPPSTGVDPTAAPGGSGRHRQFKKLNRQTKP